MSQLDDTGIRVLDQGDTRKRAGWVHGRIIYRGEEAGVLAASEAYWVVAQNPLGWASRRLTLVR